MQFANTAINRYIDRQTPHLQQANAGRSKFWTILTESPEWDPDWRLGPQEASQSLSRKVLLLQDRSKRRPGEDPGDTPESYE